jgi:hypothetical protein
MKDTSVAVPDPIPLPNPSPNCRASFRIDGHLVEIVATEVYQIEPDGHLILSKAIEGAAGQQHGLGSITLSPSELE